MARLHAGAIPCRPESRGWLRIRSPDPDQPPAMQPNYLATQGDRDTMVAGMRVLRRVFQSQAMQQLVTEEYMPGPDAQTDEQWLDHVRDTGGTTYPPDQHLHDGHAARRRWSIPTLRVHGHGGAAGRSMPR